MDTTDLAYAGAARQAALIAAREASSREIVEATLARIDALNPTLNAYRVVFAERALAEADQADARAKAGGDRPLLGVPVAIKDDVNIAGEITAMGTAAYGPAREADAEVVSRLRAAGAVIVGKTSVPEMMIWPFTETLTWGVTRNPWDLDRTPGGSSGGTGAAVAAGLAGVGLGSDGAGSIRIPASWNGLFGLKPTRDRVPIADHVDAWQGLSVNGPIARTVADAALFLDATVADAPGGGFLVAARTPPANLRIAMTAKAAPGVLFRLGADERRVYEELAQTLRSLGHEVVERDIAYPQTASLQVLTRYLRGIHDDVAAMPHPERLERRTRSMARLGGLFSDSRVAAARAQEADLADRVDDVLREFDAILMPGPAGGPTRIGAYHGRSALWTLNAVSARHPYMSIFNVTGHPVAAVPGGFDADGLPVGVQLIGPKGGEAGLLSLAGQIEAERAWADRRPPYA